MSRLTTRVFLPLLHKISRESDLQTFAHLLSKSMFWYLHDYLTNVYLLYLTVNSMRVGDMSALLTLYLLNLMESWIIDGRWSRVDWHKVQPWFSPYMSWIHDKWASRQSISESSSCWTFSFILFFLVKTWWSHEGAISWAIDNDALDQSGSNGDRKKMGKLMMFLEVLQTKLDGWVEIKED